MASLLSYYKKYSQDNRIVVEKLNDHVQQGIDITKDVDGSKIGLYVKKEELASYPLANAIKLAIIFHDTGKAFFQYNYKCDENSNVYLSFQAHEWFSAYIFKKYMEKILLNGHYTSLNELIAMKDGLNSIKFAILYHHHALSLKDRQKNLLLHETNILKTQASDILKLKELQCHLEKPGEFNNTIETIVQEYEKSKNMFVGNMLRAIEEDNLEIWRKFISDYKFRKLCLIMSTLLISIDYLSAQKRGSSSSIFFNALKDFSEYYANFGSNLL
jgi:CRISPR-associated endonuclease Cas3-HD